MKLKALRILFSLAIRGDKRKAINRYVPLLGVIGVIGIAVATTLGHADLAQQIKGACDILGACDLVDPEFVRDVSAICTAGAAIYGVVLRIISLGRKSAPTVRKALEAARLEHEESQAAKG